MAFGALQEIERICEEQDITFGKAVRMDDCNEQGITEDESLEKNAGIVADDAECGAGI